MRVLELSTCGELRMLGVLTLERWVMRRIIGNIVSSTFSVVHDSSAARYLFHGDQSVSERNKHNHTVLGHPDQEDPTETSPRTDPLPD